LHSSAIYLVIDELDLSRPPVTSRQHRCCASALGLDWESVFSPGLNGFRDSLARYGGLLVS
jgi:hypothetical protein